MHVCYVLWRFPSFTKSDYAGGAEKQLLQLVRSPDLSNHKVTIISGRKGRNQFSEILDENIHILRFPTTSIPGLSMLIFMVLLPLIIARIHFRKRIDIIHIPLPDLFILSLHLISRLLKIPVIARIAADELDQSYSVGFWALIRNFIKSVILKLDGIQALNPKAYKDAQRLGMNKNRVFLIPNGVKVPELKHDYNKLHYRILYVGAIRHFPRKLRIEQKNLHYLIDAFEEVSVALPDLRFLMVGDGNYRNALERYVESKNLESKIDFVGYIPDVFPFFQESDIVINPSHFEGMPNVVLEAMATGIYIICSDIPEHRYILGNNEFGQLVDKSNPSSLTGEILRFYKNPEPLIERAKHGRDRINNHLSLSLMTRRILKMYSVIVRDK